MGVDEWYDYAGNEASRSARSVVRKEAMLSSAHKLAEAESLVYERPYEHVGGQLRFVRRNVRRLPHALGALVLQAAEARHGRAA